MIMDKVNVMDTVRAIPETWSPQVVAELNGQMVKVVRLEGEFHWHKHTNEDEMFWVLKGSLVIKVRPDGEAERDIVLSENEFFVIPRGTEHKPVAAEECWAALFEPAETVREGD